MLYSELVEEFKDLEGFVACLNQEERPDMVRDAASFLQSNRDSRLLSREAIDANIKGLNTGQWTDMADLIANEGVFSGKNIALIVAPYHVRRPGSKQRLSLLLCEKLDVEKFPFNFAKLEAEHGKVDFKPIIPVEILHSAGNISGDSGETFIVPTAWKTMPEAANASPLLDVVGSQKRVQKMATDQFMCCLYNEDAANELIAFRDNTADIVVSRYWEYSLHEYGHAAGFFSERMPVIKGNMQQAALEEWRSDGMMASFVQRHLMWGDITEDQARNILMSNFLTRFGMDVVRNKNRIDHDVLASYYIFSSLESTGLIQLNEGKLSLLGDTSQYSYWKQLYLGMTHDAAIVTEDIRETKGRISFAPTSENVALEDFIKLIEGAIDCADGYSSFAKSKPVNG